MATDEDEDLRQMMRMPAYRMPGREGDRLRAAVMDGFATRYPGPARFDATGRMETGVVAVRSYPRREPDGGVHQVRAHDRAAPPSQGRAPAAPPQVQRPAVSVPRAWEGQINQAWREQIAGEEVKGRMDTAHGYDVARDGPTGALGRYQMTPDALRGARWQNDRGQWTARANEAGVTDRASFLANPQAQEQSLNDYLRDNEDQLRRLGTFRYVGQQVSGLSGPPVPITVAGIAAAAHRYGPSGTNDYIRSRLDGRSPRNDNERLKFRAIEGRLRRFSNQSYQRFVP